MAVGLLSGLHFLDLELVDEYMVKQETPKKPWCVLHSKTQYIRRQLEVILDIHTMTHDLR